MLRDLGDDEGLIQQLTAVGLRALAERDDQAACAALDEVIDLARRLGRRDVLGQALLNRGVAEIEAGRLHEATRWLAQSIAVTRSVGDRIGTAYALSNLGLARYSLGEHVEARTYLLAALDLAVALELPWGIASLLDGLGIIAAATGDAERAARLFGRADTLLAELGDPPLRFLRDERPAIRAAVREALGATAYLTAYAQGAAMTQEEALAEARRSATTAPAAHPTPTRTDRPTLPRLTARETEVLAWLLQGRSTKEIARALVLSPRTVERHLANLYLKLGVNSRGEAIALVLRADATSPRQP
jgi:DNA-binding CsgD family transcriptional regulator